MKKLLLITLLWPMVLLAQDDCKGIMKINDKFDDADYPTYQSSPFFRPFTVFKKFLKDAPPLTFAFFEASGSVPTLNGNKIIFLLSNGDKVEVPSDVSVKVSGSSTGLPYRYTATVIIDNDLSDRLSQHEVTDYRIHIFDVKLKKKMSQDLKQYITCLKTIIN